MNIISYRGVWKMGDVYDGELWTFTYADGFALARIRGRISRMLSGKFDAIELRLKNNQLVRVRKPS